LRPEGAAVVDPPWGRWRTATGSRWRLKRLVRSLGTDAARGRAIAPLLDRLEHRAAELETENHQLRRRITDLEAELRDTPTAFTRPEPQTGTS
jgi:hypothetical protein